MRNLKILLGLVTLSALCATAGWASNNSAAQFLKMGAGARATAMGNAQTAVADDITASYWNPAGLTGISGSQIAVMHNEGLVDTQYEHLGFATRTGRAVTALNVYNMNYGSIDRYDNTNVRGDAFNAGSMAAGLTYASSIRENISLGIGAKYIKESIDDEDASGAAVDFGMLYTLGKTTIGASVLNLGQKIKFSQEEFSLPTRVSLGAAHSISPRLLLALDASKYIDNDLTYHLGIDYAAGRVVSLRAGYEATPGNQINVDGLTGVSGGIGLHLSVFSIDYAMRPFGDLGDVHRISLLIKFNRLNK